MTSPLLTNAIYHTVDVGNDDGLIKHPLVQHKDGQLRVYTTLGILLLSLTKVTCACGLTLGCDVGLHG